MRSSKEQTAVSLSESHDIFKFISLRIKRLTNSMNLQHFSATSHCSHFRSARVPECRRGEVLVPA